MRHEWHTPGHTPRASSTRPPPRSTRYWPTTPHTTRESCQHRGSDLRVEAGGIGAGTVFRITLRVVGRRQTLHMKVAEPAPGHVLTETNLDNGVVTEFKVRERGSQTLTRITSKWETDSLLDRLLTPLVMRRVFARQLRNLDNYVRSLKPGPSSTTTIAAATGGLADRRGVDAVRASGGPGRPGFRDPGCGEPGIGTGVQGGAVLFQPRVALLCQGYECGVDGFSPAHRLAARPAPQWFAHAVAGGSRWTAESGMRRRGRSGLVQPPPDVQRVESEASLDEQDGGFLRRQGRCPCKMRRDFLDRPRAAQRRSGPLARSERLEEVDEREALLPDQFGKGGHATSVCADGCIRGDARSTRCQPAAGDATKMQNGWPAGSA